MEKKLILTLKNHKVYYIKTDTINFYINIPNVIEETSISIEIKSKVSNYNLELNDEVWVMENIKNTFSYIDDYNITLVLPIFNEECIGILEKIDDTRYSEIDQLLAKVINCSYLLLKEEKKNVLPQINLVNNDRYKTFINWFMIRYQNRVVCRNLLDLIQLYNANATSYKKLETPVMNFVVGSYNTEIEAPKVVSKNEEAVQLQKTLKPKYSSGFSSYMFLAIITIVVGLIVTFIALNYK